MQNQSNSLITFDTQLKTALWNKAMSNYCTTDVKQMLKLFAGPLRSRIETNILSCCLINEIGALDPMLSSVLDNKP